MQFYPMNYDDYREMVDMEKRVRQDDAVLKIDRKNFSKSREKLARKDAMDRQQETCVKGRETECK